MDAGVSADIDGGDASGLSVLADLSDGLIGVAGVTSSDAAELATFIEDASGDANGVATGVEAADVVGSTFEGCCPPVAFLTLIRIYMAQSDCNYPL